MIDMQGRPKTSVIIPHLNQAEQLHACLTSLLGQTDDAEIIVVDNGSDVLPIEVCELFQNVVLVSEPTPGPGPARNKGVELAQAPILAFIDADCLADPAWIRSVEEEFQDPSTQVIGGDVRIAFKDASNVTQLEAYESVFAYRQKMYIEKQGFSGTGNLAMRREVHAAVGPFAGIGIAEDRDWGRRATELGYRIKFRPKMTVFHPARTSFSQLQAKWERHISHDYAEAERTLSWNLFWCIKATALLLSPAWELIRIASSDRLHGIRSRFRAWTALCRIRFFRCRNMLLLLASSNPRISSEKWNR